MLRDVDDGFWLVPDLDPTSCQLVINHADCSGFRCCDAGKKKPAGLAPSGFLQQRKG
jgi:hypothetical protein